MGFGDWVKKKYDAVKTGVTRFVDRAKEVGKDVVDGAVELGRAAYNKGKEIFEKGKEIVMAVDTAVTETVKGWKSGVKPTIGGGGRINPGGKTNHSEDIARLEIRGNVIADYQKHVSKDAKTYEGIVRDAYLKKYKPITKALRVIMDTRHIEKFIKSKSKTFANLMRDEINSEITLGNRKLKALMDDTSLSQLEYKHAIQDFADKIYDNAKDNLLDVLESVFSETDSYIKIHVSKFLQDEQKTLIAMKENMQKLCQEGGARERELEKIGMEYATLSFIRSLADNPLN